MEDELKKKLLGIGLKEEDLAEVTVAFDTAVESMVNERLVEEKAKIDASYKAKADDFCEKKIAQELEFEKADLQKISEEWLQKKANTLAKKAQMLVDKEVERIEENTSQYIDKYFNEAFQEKFGVELANIEESVISSVDQYLDLIIAEKVGPQMIESAAMNETFAPIIQGIQNLFETQYVPLNNSGTAKLEGAKKEISSLEESLKEQVKANMKLAVENEKFQKNVLIAEKCSELSAGNRVKLKKFFENKPFATVKSDIEEYCLTLEKESSEKANLIAEKAELERRLQMRKPTPEPRQETVRPLSERVISTDVAKHIHTEPKLEENVSNRFRAQKESLDEALLKRAASLL